MQIALWVFIAVYYLVITSYHLAFTDWLLTAHQTPFGAIKPAVYLRNALTVTALFAALYVAYRARRGHRRLVTFGYWIAWLVAMFFVDRILIYSLPEYLHIPQYAILAWLLAKVMDPDRSRFVIGKVLFWVTLLGAVDELNQYLFLTTRYSHYYDFNDILINTLSAVAGALLYYGFQPQRQVRQSTKNRQAALRRSRVSQPSFFRRISCIQTLKPAFPELLIFTLGAVLVSSLLVTGYLQTTPSLDVSPGGFQVDEDGKAILYLQRSSKWYGSWQRAAHNERYWILGPLSGSLLVVACGLLCWPFSPGIMGDTARGNIIPPLKR